MEKLLLGKLVNTHGIKGEVKIHSSNEESAYYLQPGEMIFLEFGKTMLEFKVVSHRAHKKMDMVKFEGLDNINDVEKYKGCKVYVIEEEFEVELEEDEVLVGDLVGCQVVTTEGQDLGEVVEVFNTGASDILRVKGQSEQLIPYVNSIIVSEDFESKVITIDAIEGLIE